MKLFLKFLCVFSLLAFTSYAANRYSFDVKEGLKKTDSNRLKSISLHLYSPDYTPKWHTMDDWAHRDELSPFNEMKREIESPYFFDFERKNKGLNLGISTAYRIKSKLDLNDQLSISPSWGLYSEVGIGSFAEIGLPENAVPMLGYHAMLGLIRPDLRFCKWGKLHFGGSSSIQVQFSRLMFDSFRGHGLIDTNPLNIVSRLKRNNHFIGIRRFS